MSEYEELPRRPRRRALTPTSLALLSVLLLAGGFIGGVLVEKGQVDSSTSPGRLTTRPAGAQLAGAPSGTGARGEADAQAPFGRSSLARHLGSGPSAVAVGQVAYVEGDTLYVESAEGTTVKVTPSAGSTVTRTVTSSIKGIHPGEMVFARGETDSHGTLAARSIGVEAGTGPVLFGK